MITSKKPLSEKERAVEQIKKYLLVQSLRRETEVSARGLFVKRPDTETHMCYTWEELTQIQIKRINQSLKTALGLTVGAQWYNYFEFTESGEPLQIPYESRVTRRGRNKER